MKMFDKIKSYFHKNENNEISSDSSENKEPLLDLSTINQFDDIWINIDNVIYEGWVVEKTKNILKIVYSDKFKCLQDIELLIDRPLNRTIITQNDIVFYLNKTQLPYAEKENKKDLRKM